MHTARPAGCGFVVWVMQHFTRKAVSPEKASRIRLPPMKLSPGPWSKVLLASGFSLVCGYADVLTLIRWESFLTMMTGNALFLCRALFNVGTEDSTDGRLKHVLIIFTFLSGVLLYPF